MSQLSATILGLQGPILEADEAMFFQIAQPWGFILFARNIEGPEQVRRLTRDLRDCVGRDAPILIDQEGGRVQRLGPPHWRQWRPPLDQMMAAGQQNAARAMGLRARLIASELHDLGIDVNCIPLADLTREETHPFLRNRTYGATAEGVIEAGRAVAEGLMAGGVLPVLKHLPGHGRAHSDSHESLPRVTASAQDLRSNDFAAFAALSDLPLGMTAHVVFEAFDADAPATLSPKMLRLVREEIGFGGLLMTDDLSMGALPGAIGARAASAIKAGCDLILHCNGDRGEMEDVLGECGALDAQSAIRAEAALAARRPPEPLDIAAVEADLSDLLNGEVYG